MKLMSQWIFGGPSKKYANNCHKLFITHKSNKNYNSRGEKTAKESGDQFTVGTMETGNLKK